MSDELQVTDASDGLVQDLRVLIGASRGRVARAVNSELVALYWSVGKRLREDVLGRERAAYGREVIGRVATALTAEFGRGFGQRSLYRMVRFAEAFPDEQIVSALRSELSWTHFRQLQARICHQRAAPIRPGHTHLPHRRGSTTRSGVRSPLRHEIWGTLIGRNALRRVNAASRVPRHRHLVAHRSSNRIARAVVTHPG